MTSAIDETTPTPSKGFASEAAVRKVDSITSDDFFVQYLVPRIPLVVCGAAATWPAADKWTWDWLVNSFGAVHVMVSDAREQKHEVRLSEYIDYVLNPVSHTVTDGPLYLKDLQFSGELCADYKTPDFLEDWFAEFPPELKPVFRWFFIGPPSSGSHLHIDTSGTHAWLTQIKGEKEWLLFPPEDIPEFYCDVADAFAPDFDRFEAFKYARCFRAIVKPGETIFTPAGWRHQVRNLGPSWALTENFFNASNVDDLYRCTVSPEIRPILESLCLHKASQMLQTERSDLSLLQCNLLNTFFQNRERDLLHQLADVRSAIETLSHGLIKMPES